MTVSVKSCVPVRLWHIVYWEVRLVWGVQRASTEQVTWHFLPWSPKDFKASLQVKFYFSVYNPVFSSNFSCSTVEAYFSGITFRGFHGYTVNRHCTVNIYFAWLWCCSFHLTQTNSRLKMGHKLKSTTKTLTDPITWNVFTALRSYEEQWWSGEVPAL